MEILQDKVIAPLEAQGLPAGVRLRLSGTADKLTETWQAMVLQLIMALVIVYLVMACAVRELCVSSSDRAIGAARNSRCSDGASSTEPVPVSGARHADRAGLRDLDRHRRKQRHPACAPDLVSTCAKKA